MTCGWLLWVVVWCGAGGWLVGDCLALSDGCALVMSTDTPAPVTAHGLVLVLSFVLLVGFVAWREQADYVLQSVFGFAPSKRSDGSQYVDRDRVAQRGTTYALVLCVACGVMCGTVRCTGCVRALHLAFCVVLNKLVLNKWVNREPILPLRTAAPQAPPQAPPTHMHRSTVLPFSLSPPLALSRTYRFPHTL